MRKICAILFSILAVDIAASAQLPTSGNVFFGYSYSQGSAFTGTARGGVNMSGWEGSAEGKFLPWIGIVADFDWHYGSRSFTGCVGNPCSIKTFSLSASRHTVSFGPRASVSLGKYTPFAEFLVGISHQTDTGGGISNSDTGFSTAIGGGLDYKLIKGIALRAQGDSVRTNLFGAKRNDLRISTGIVFRF